MFKKILLYFALLLWFVVPSWAQPTLSLLDTNGSAGNVVNMDLSVADFTDIVSFQFTIKWDPNLVQYIGTNNYQISTFGVNNIGDAPTNVDNGELIVSWLDNNLNGVSLPDNSTLFSLQFLIKNGSSFTTTQVEITNAPTVIEVIDVNLNDIGMNSEPGTITNTSLNAAAEITTADFTVFPNYPNPFYNGTTINFTLPKANTITLTLLNATGKVISTQSNFFGQGENEIFLGKSLFPTSGVYTYRFESENNSINQKLIFIQ